MLLVILFLLLPGPNWAECEEPFCPSQKPISLFNNQNYEADTIDLGQEPESGCLCRLNSNTWTICFGRYDCVKFPRKLNITTTAMRLKVTKIYELEPGDLNERFKNLELLEIDDNYNLTIIRSGTFQEMSRLQSLSLSGNNLTIFEKETFIGLSALRELALVNNKFTVLDNMAIAVTKNILPKLEDLDISQNNFVEIFKDDFQAMLGLDLIKLNLMLCQIEYIHPEALKPLSSLSTLLIGQNFLNSTILTMLIEQTLRYNKQLWNLDLYSLGFRKYPPRQLFEVIANSGIRHLNLGRNQFEVITEKTFPPLPKLEFLDLSDCSILEIEDRAFLNFPKLRKLLLRGNQLKTIPNGTLLKELDVLDLQNNSGSRLKYHLVEDQPFIKMQKLQSLNLAYNIVNAIYNNSFIGLDNLKLLGLKNGTIYFIANSSFVMLPQLIYLNLQNNFIGEKRTIYPKVFDGLANLQVLLLSGCRISNFNPKLFESLRSLYYLGLDRNYLTTIYDFPSLPNLNTLALMENQLQGWHKPAFKNLKLKTLILIANKVSYLSSAMVKDFSNLTNLQLSNNPIVCDCSTYTVLQENIEILDNAALCAFPNEVSNLSIVQFAASNQNCSHYTRFLPITFIVIAGVVLIAAMILYFRWHFRYILYKVRKNCGKHHKITSNYYENLLYDAFVSYSSKDQDFVGCLMTTLENQPPYFRLCVYERDFEPGTMIMENVILSLKQSRKTIIIISDNYLKSQWCKWESNYAEFQRFQKELDIDNLIIIKLGNINENQLTPMLRYLMKTRVYLQWNEDNKKQQLFWEKLRRILTPLGGVIESSYL